MGKNDDKMMMNIEKRHWFTSHCGLRSSQPAIRFRQIRPLQGIVTLGTAAASGQIPQDRFMEVLQPQDLPKKNPKALQLSVSIWNWQWWIQDVLRGFMGILLSLLGFFVLLPEPLLQALLRCGFTSLRQLLGHRLTPCARPRISPNISTYTNSDSWMLSLCFFDLFSIFLAR